MSNVDLAAVLVIAVEAARVGGKILRDSFGKVKEIAYKGTIDIVTEVDKASEAAILDILKSHTGSSGFSVLGINPSS